MFLHPLGLLALLAVPAVIGLHLYRRRFRNQVVSAVFLWQPRDHAPVSGRKREPLRTNPSFWCEVLSALLLALAFAAPRFLGAGEAQLLVAVVDASASMGGRPNDGSASFAEQARSVVRERIERLPRDARVTLIQSGARPKVLAGPNAFRSEALEALAQYQPTLARHDLQPAVALALQLAGANNILVVSDELETEAWPDTVELTAVGTALENFAITHAARRRVRSDAGVLSDRIDLTVSSFARRSTRLVIEIDADGVELERRELTLAPGERTHLAFDVADGTGVVELRLPDDALAIDNVAWLAPVPPRTVAVATTFDATTARALGLASGREGASLVDRVLSLAAECIDPGDPQLAHLVLGPVADNPQAWNVTFDADGDERVNLVAPFLIDKRHRLLDGVTLEGVVWSASATPERADGIPLVSAGNLPLVTEKRRGTRVDVYFNVDLERSSLHRSPDWPILLSNLIETRRRALPGPARTSLALGETFTFRAEEAAEYVFTGPETSRTLETRGVLTIDDVPRPGIYTLSQAGRELCQVGFSFVDAMESDLRELASGERAAQGTDATILAGYTWTEIALLTLALALLLLDWFVLSRSTQVARS